MSSSLVDIWLEWTGREPPPTDKYMAVAHFSDAGEDESVGTVWSIVLHAPPVGFASSGPAKAAMLVPEASGHYLVAGAHFEVMAGRKKVAEGRVVSEADRKG